MSIWLAVVIIAFSLWVSIGGVDRLLNKHFKTLDNEEKRH